MRVTVVHVEATRQGRRESIMYRSDLIRFPPAIPLQWFRRGRVGAWVGAAPRSAAMPRRGRAPHEDVAGVGGVMRCVTARAYLCACAAWMGFIECAARRRRARTRGASSLGDAFCESRIYVNKKRAANLDPNYISKKWQRRRHAHTPLEPAVHRRASAVIRLAPPIPPNTWSRRVSTSLPAPRGCPCRDGADAQSIFPSTWVAVVGSNRCRSQPPSTSRFGLR